MAGIEPATYPLPWGCSTNLSYIGNMHLIYYGIITNKKTSHNNDDLLNKNYSISMMGADEHKGEELRDLYIKSNQDILDR
jgi:hypothetical protein